MTGPLVRRLVAEAFATLGIRVLVEAINPIDMPGFLINTPEHLDALLRAVDHPNLAAQYDLYHMARQGLDVAAGIRLLAGRIGHVQFADVPGRGAPGTGELAFPALLGALRDSGYSGWLGAQAAKAFAMACEQGMTDRDDSAMLEFIRMADKT